MNSIIDFLKLLDEGAPKKKPVKKKLDKDVFKDDELMPVVLAEPSPEGGAGSPLPTPPLDRDTEVINPPAVPDSKGDADDDSKRRDRHLDDPDTEDDDDSEKKPEGEEGEEGEKGAGDDEVTGGGKGDEEAKITVEREVKAVPESEGDDLPRTLDSHDILETGDPSDAEEMTKDIFEKAEKQRADIEERTGSEQKGEGAGGFIEKIKGIYKPRIDWVRELKKVIQAFKTKFAKSFDRRVRDLTAKRYKQGVGHTKTKSYPSWLKNPRSHSQQKGQPDMLFKGPYVKAPLNEIVLIVALDTSGSVSYKTIEKCMGEMDSIARAFKSGISTSKGKLEGKVYFMMWDWVFQNIDEYKAGDWKKYREEGKKGIVGRGGTRVGVVYEYLNKRFKCEEGAQYGVLSVLGTPTKRGLSKDEFIFPVKEGRAQVAPFVVIVTDGYTEVLTNEDLGKLYQDNHDSIINLIIDGDSSNAYPKNIIKYESYKI